MERRRSIVTIATISLLQLAACGGPTTRSGAGEESRSEPQPRWTVRIGSSGGFTGGGEGQIIHADGRVQSWSQIVPGERISLEDVGHASAETLRALREAMTDPELVAIEHREAGNLTGFLECIEEDRVRRYSWAERLGEPEIPPPLGRAVAAARAAAASARE